MAQTPKSIKVALDLDKPLIRKALEDSRRMGHEEGLQKGRQEILDWLENAYMRDPRPDRGTPLAEAILQMATAAREHFLPLTQPRPTQTKEKGRRK